MGPAPFIFLYEYVVRWIMPPAPLPTHPAKVLSPWLLSVDGWLIWTLNKLCHAYYGVGYSHLNHPENAYSLGNGASTVYVFDGVPGFLVI